MENHKKWFLQNHENALSEFEKSVEAVYPKKREPQMSLLDQLKRRKCGDCT